jgi:hypothetical protein
MFWEKKTVFWDVVLCNLAETYQCIGWTYCLCFFVCPENVGSTFPWNTGQFLQDNTVSHTRRKSFWVTTIRTDGMYTIRIIYCDSTAPRQIQWRHTYFIIIHKGPCQLLQTLLAKQQFLWFCKSKSSICPNTQTQVSEYTGYWEPYKL